MYWNLIYERTENDVIHSLLRSMKGGKGQLVILLHLLVNSVTINRFVEMKGLTHLMRCQKIRILTFIDLSQVQRYKIVSVEIDQSIREHEFQKRDHYK